MTTMLERLQEFVENEMKEAHKSCVLSVKIHEPPEHSRADCVINAVVKDPTGRLKKRVCSVTVRDRQSLTEWGDALCAVGKWLLEERVTRTSRGDWP